MDDYSSLREQIGLERERRFDSDLWVVEIETDEIGTLLTLVDPPGA